MLLTPLTLFSGPLWTHLCDVNLMTGQLTDLKRRHAANHNLVPVRTAPDDDLRLVGGAARLVARLVIDGVL